MIQTLFLVASVVSEAAGTVHRVSCRQVSDEVIGSFSIHRLNCWSGRRPGMISQR